MTLVHAGWKKLSCKWKCSCNCNTLHFYIIIVFHKIVTWLYLKKNMEWLQVQYIQFLPMHWQHCCLAIRHRRAPDLVTESIGVRRVRRQVQYSTVPLQTRKRFHLLAIVCVMYYSMAHRCAGVQIPVGRIIQC